MLAVVFLINVSGDEIFVVSGEKLTIIHKSDISQVFLPADSLPVGRDIWTGQSSFLLDSFYHHEI
jgi:hypothetical protein